MEKPVGSGHPAAKQEVLVPQPSPAPSPSPSPAVPVEVESDRADPSGYLESLRRALNPAVAAAEAAAAAETARQEAEAKAALDAIAKAKAEEMYVEDSNSRVAHSRVPFASPAAATVAAPLMRTPSLTNRKVTIREDLNSNKPVVFDGLKLLELLSQRCTVVEGDLKRQAEGFAAAIHHYEDEAATSFILEHKHRHAMKAPSSSAPTVSTPTSRGNAAAVASADMVISKHLDELFQGGGDDEDTPQSPNKPSHVHASPTLYADPFETLVLGRPGVWKMKDIQDILTNTYLCKIKGLQASIGNNNRGLYTKINRITQKLIKKFTKKRLLYTNQVLHEYYQKGEQMLFYNLIHHQEVLDQQQKHCEERIREEVKEYYQNMQHRENHLMDCIRTSYEEAQAKYTAVLKQIYEEGSTHSHYNQQLDMSINQYVLSKLQGIQEKYASLPSTGQRTWRDDLDDLDASYLAAYDKVYRKLVSTKQDSCERSEGYASKYALAVQAALSHKRRIIERGEERLTYAEHTIEGHYLSFMEECSEQISRLRGMQEQLWMYDKHLQYYLDMLQRRREDRNKRRKDHDSDSNSVATGKLTSAGSVGSSSSSKTTVSPSKLVPGRRGYIPGSLVPSTPTAAAVSAPPVSPTESKTVSEDNPLEEDIDVLLSYFSSTTGTGPDKRPIFQIGTKMRILAELTQISPVETEKIMLCLLGTCQA